MQIYSQRLCVFPEKSTPKGCDENAPFDDAVFSSRIARRQKKVLLADDVVKACEKGSHKPMTIICKCDQAPGRRTPREKQGVANRCQGNRDCLAPSNHMTILHACKT